MSKVLVSETNLTAIADAIRTKKGSEDTYKPGEMAAAINSITTGSGGEGLPEGALTIKGDCRYKFYGDSWNWYLENYGSQVTCGYLTDAESMFENNSLSEIPLNLSGLSRGKANKMFYNCQNLTKAPTLNATFKPSDTSSIFENCYKLKTFPRYFFTWFRADNINAYSMFRKCYSLEELPNNLFTIIDKIRPDGVNVSFPAITDIKSATYMFCECYKLRKIQNFPSYGPEEGAATNNILDCAFNALYMLDTLTFKNITTKSYLTNCVVDLTNCVGYALSPGQEGFDTAKCVSDDTTYQALKNTNDWWSYRRDYSRYNKISAEATVKSLPRLVDGYTSTIKFDGNCGSLTDGGAINTMSEEVIAVATDRGWTVSLV